MKINIIGTSCSGKTTLASHIAQELRVKHIELDSSYWLPNWQELDRETFRTKATKQVEDNQCISPK